MGIQQAHQTPANDADTEDFGERSVEITVRTKLGTYETSMLCKMRASCTSGPKQAAEALGRKVFGTRFLTATACKPAIVQEGVTCWHLNYIESAVA